MLTARPRIRFADFEVDFHTRELRRAGAPIKLQAQPFKVLEILLEHPGELVTREELRTRIWPTESFGDFDHAVNIAVGKLRTALGDVAGEPRLVETLPRRGYRFLAVPEPVADETSPETTAVPQPGTRGRRIAVPLGAGAILLALGYLVGHRAAPQQPFRFQRLTARRGTIAAARFAPGGRNVFYAAAWDGAPLEIFSTDPQVAGTQRLGLPGTQLLAVSSTGTMAVLQPVERRFLLTVRGTLAEVPVTGGSPRQVAENVGWADWSPDGAALALVRETGGKSRLEFPAGHLLFETSGWIGHPRVSPRGDLVAFLEHPTVPDDAGDVAVVDRTGKKRALSTGWESAEGLAWSPDGGEVWFTAARTGVARELHSVDLEGRERLRFRAPGSLTLLDIAADGRLLLTRDDQRVGILAHVAGAAGERDLSWGDWSLPTALSPDSATLLFDEQGVLGGPGYTVAVRDLHGSPPTPLGQGLAGDFSLDGKWVTTIRGSDTLQLLPIGAGEAKTVARADVERYWHGAHVLPDGKRLLITANRAGEAARCFMQELDGTKPRPVTPEGVALCVASPDGQRIAGSRLDGGVGWIGSLADGTGHALPGSRPGDRFVWSAEPDVVYAYRPGQVPLRVDRLNVLTGARTTFRELSPADATGLGDISHVLIGADGETYAYGYTRFLSDLYLTTP